MSFVSAQDLKRRTLTEHALSRKANFSIGSLGNRQLTQKMKYHRFAFLYYGWPTRVRFFHSWAVQKRLVFLISDISKRNGKYSIRDQRVMSHMIASCQYIRKTKIQMTILCVSKETYKHKRDVHSRSATSEKETDVLYSSSISHVNYVHDQ